MHSIKSSIRTAACAAGRRWRSAHPRDYPTRPITLSLFAPGGLSDVPARLLAAEMQQHIGQSIVVENRPGASGITGASSVLRAAPDGLPCW